MKSLTVLYPGGIQGVPTTGGQVYDYRLFKIISDYGVDISFIGDEGLGRKHDESIFLLPIRLISKINVLSRNKILIFNTSLFPYYIIPFFLLKILYPYLTIIGIHHHFRFQEQEGIKRRLYKLLEFINLKQCHKVICPCPYTREVIMENWKNGRIINLENSFEIVENRVSAHTEYKFLYVGSVYERKGLTYLLEALSLVPQEKRERITIDIIGNLDYSDRYVKKLLQIVDQQNLGSIVKFRGRISDEALHGFYSDAYAFVFPSLLEGYGLVIIEAMSYGLPVIAFNNSAMPYSIRHGFNGLLAENKNAQSFCDCMMTLIDNQEMYKIMSENAKQYALKAYSFEDFRQDTIKFLNTLDFA